jgi:hypothetical protein
LIEATAPWLAPYARRLPLPLQGVAAALNAHPDAPRHFVPQSALPAGEPYEAFIARSGCVPTRDNLHDAFNGLVWLQEPLLKARLNELQAEALARSGVQAQRGPLRDALTLFDENGAIWSDCPAPIQVAWRQRDWRTLFVTHRRLWQHSQPRLFGHALLEQLHSAPRKGLTAHVLLADPLTLSAEDWSRKPFLPLPVLGVPGWHPGNADPDFYDDPAVFRPLRAVTA